MGASGNNEIFLTFGSARFFGAQQLLTVFLQVKILKVYFLGNYLTEEYLTLVYSGPGLKTYLLMGRSGDGNCNQT